MSAASLEAAATNRVPLAGIMSPSAPSSRSAQRDHFVWGLTIFGFSLLLRGLQVWQVNDSVASDMILGDAQNYDARAREIASGDWIGDQVFYQAPLYSYFLAVVYRFVGDAPLVVRLVQMLLGATSCVFLAQAGWRFFGKPAGIAAGLLLAVYAPAIFFDSMLQKSCIDVFLVCASLWVLSEIDPRRSRGSCFGLGVLLAVLVLSRENALVFCVVVLAWLLLLPSAAWRTRVALAASLAAGIGLVLLPVALRNASVSGDFHLTTSQFGHNFFIGNNEAADGTYKPLLHARGDPRVEIQDAIDLAEKQSGRELSRGEVSDFYFQRGLRFIASQPADWARLMLRKLRLAFNAVEIVDTEDQYTHAEWSFVLRWTGLVMHFGLLAPLALLGVWVTWPQRSRLLPLYLLASSYLAGLLIFYVFARYRMPLVPFVVLFAAAGICGCADFFRSRGTGGIAALCLSVLALTIFCNWPMIGVDRMRSVTHFNIGNELVARERVEDGAHYYREAIRLHADNALANHNLGALLAERGDFGRAKAHFERALEIAPDYAQARSNLARVHNDLGLRSLAAGERERAAISFREALRIDPSFSEAGRNLAAIEP
ncbi:MAG: tetratricopeptide repeat protein [Myxococcota bacterium]|nr:tetratricopeptide repeat protein [Myxococcota bacterium]